VVTRALRLIAEGSGAGAAKSARACLSGMFSLAIEDGAAKVNPVRDSSARISSAKRSPRALTVEQTHELVILLRGNERARSLDLPDLVDWMLATGSRIGEALALRWGVNAEGKPLLDLDAGTWKVNATIVCVAGKGFEGAEATKDSRRLAGRRSAGLRCQDDSGPARASRGRRRRLARLHPPYAGGLRDPNNVSGDLRRLLDSFGWEHCARTGSQVADDGSFKRATRAALALRPGAMVLGHVSHIAENRGHATRRGPTESSRRSGSTGACPIDNAGCVFR
jgi:hypothetical protein